MLLAIVKKADGKRLDHGKFESEEAVNLWFQPFIDSGVYGKPQHIIQELVTPAVFNENNEEIVPAVFNNVVIPAEFNIEIMPYDESLE